MHGVHNLFYDGIMYPPALRLHEDIHNTALSRANYSTRNPQINMILNNAWLITVSSK